ncbi:hypothetical protein [Streptomyces sp. NPDC101145]
MGRPGEPVTARRPQCAVCPFSDR